MIPLVMSIIAKTETFQRDMARARGHVGMFGKTVRGTSTIMTGFSRQLMALAGVGGGLYTLQRVIRGSVGEFASFERGMANVGTLLDEQSMRFLPSYGEQIRRMSMDFGEGTEILSKGLYDIISASVAPSKAMKVLDISVKAAKAGMSDTAIAADALTTILNSYGYEAEKAERVSDILFTTIRRGKTTFGELAPNIGKVTSLAATAGLSFEELSAAISTMTRAGVQTEIAITSLRALILSFLKPQSDSIKAAKKFGLELSSNTLKTEGLTGVIKKLESATAEELATIIPTSRAIAGFSAAIKNAAGNAHDYKAALDSAGATQEAFEKVMDITLVQLERANQSIKDLKRTIGEELAPATIAASEGISYYVKNLLPIVWLSRGLKLKELREELEELRTMKFSAPELMGTQIESEIDNLNRRLAEAYPKPEFIGPPKPSAKELQEGLRDVKKANYDIAQAYVRMYDQIDSRSAESFKWRERLIKEEYELYAEKMEGKEDLVEDLRKNEEMLLQMEKDLALGGPLEGIGVALYELKRDLPTVADLFRDLTKTGIEGLVDGLNEALWKTRDLDEAMKELGMTMAKMATQWLLQQAVVGGLTGIGGALGLGMAAPVAHDGGRVGDLNQHRFVSPAIFAGAPRYHDLKPGETAVIAQNDEVISRPMLGGGSKLEDKLDTVINLLSQRQTLNAMIVDKRDVVTGERMSGREGERWTMEHVRRNS